MTTDLATQRLDALYARITQLESSVEGAGFFLDRGLAQGWSEEDAKVALAILQGALQQGFKAALLCSKGMTDEQLTEWFSQIPEETKAS